MRLVKSLIATAIAGHIFGGSPAYSADISQILQQFSSSVHGWSDLESRLTDLTNELNAAQSNGSLTGPQVSGFKAQIEKIKQEEIAAQATGSRMGVVDMFKYTNTLNLLATQVNQTMQAKQSTIPDVGAYQILLGKQITDARAANQLTQSDADKFNQELHAVADMESAFKSTGDGTLSPKQADLLTAKFDVIKAGITQQIAQSQSAIPEINSRREALQKKINDSANLLTAEQSNSFKAELAQIASTQQTYTTSGNISGSQIYSLATSLDKLERKIDESLSGRVVSSANPGSPNSPSLPSDTSSWRDRTGARNPDGTYSSAPGRPGYPGQTDGPGYRGSDISANDPRNNDLGRPGYQVPPGDTNPDYSRNGALGRPGYRVAPGGSDTSSNYPRNGDLGRPGYQVPPGGSDTNPDYSRNGALGRPGFRVSPGGADTSPDYPRNGDLGRPGFQVPPSGNDTSSEYPRNDQNPRGNGYTNSNSSDDVAIAPPRRGSRGGNGDSTGQDNSYGNSGNQSNLNTNESTSLDSTTSGSSYKDVQGYWGEPYISGLASRGIIGGFPDGSFKPNDQITRAQFAAIAAKALSVPTAGASATFRDVPARHWAANVISAVSSAGLVTGFPDGTFRPEDKITRAQALVILAKALKSAAPNANELNSYSDASQVPNWAQQSVSIAAGGHIIVNYPDPSLIRPIDFATRGEVAALMYQTLLNSGKDLPRVTIGVLHPQRR